MGMFQWWYGEGWRLNRRANYLGLIRTADFFSIGLLFKTLFKPYKQISAGGVNGPLPVRLRAFADRSFSRVFGAVIRLIFILIGIVVLLIRLIWSLISVLSWGLLPLVPVVGVVLWQIGVSW